MRTEADIVAQLKAIEAAIEFTKREVTKERYVAEIDKVPTDVLALTGLIEAKRVLQWLFTEGDCRDGGPMQLAAVFRAEAKELLERIASNGLLKPEG